MEYLIRPLEQNEYHIFENMLYEAIYQPDKNNLIPREVLKLPEVHEYINNFGQEKDDYCLVADFNGKIVGAVWTRILAGDVKGFGNIDNETPEFAISLYKEYRNRGIGTKLMNVMIEYLRNSRYKQASLNVKKKNYAVRLYKNMGFEIIGEDKEDYLMLLRL
ncbi:MAG: GNAT family N-acetyltransferase [Petrimonas sp.]|nr:GNAT family N-acetyltransferase [Petrimonas sp.]MEA4980512.1 GNAT family N-acetyltransferase [Petrimonas sp.]MEA5062027.1 GNAT family N-acetyltransferase [Petrimonas sp.]